MSKLTFVNVKVAPYNEFLKLTSNNVAHYKENAAWLNKTYADKLLAAAKRENVDIYLESVMRSPAKNAVGDTGKSFGSSHETGKATDISAVSTHGKPLDLTNRRAKVVNFITKYSATKDSLFNSGSQRYIKKFQGKITIVDSNGNPIPISDKNLAKYDKSEWMHMEDGTYALDNKEVSKAISKAISSNNSLGREYGYKDPGYTDSPTGPTTGPVQEMIFDTDINGVPTGKPSYTYTKLNKSIVADKVSLDNTYLKNLDINTSKITVTNVDGSTGIPFVIPAKNTNSISTAMSTPTGYAPYKYATYVEKSNYVLPNDSREISSKELSLKGSLEDKRIKNAIGCKNPFGILEKYRASEQPASLRLILDKLFENERTQSAIKKWEAYENSEVTYIDQFIMERVSTQRKENYRVVASLGEEYKVYFGTAAPEVLSITGYTLNIQNQQWLYDFRYFYENYLRGSRLVENRIRAFLTFTDSIFEVLPVSFSYSESAKIPGAVTLSIDCVVLQWVPFGGYTDPLTRSTTKTTATSPIFSPAQTEFSNRTLGILSKVQESYKDTAGLNDLQRYTQLWSQQSLVNIPGGLYKLPFYTKPSPDREEKVNLVASPTSEVSPWLKEKFPSIYDEQRKQVDLAGLNTTESVSATQILSANRSGPFSDTYKTNVKNTINNYFNKGHNLS